VNGIDYEMLDHELIIPAGRQSASLFVRPRFILGFQPARTVMVTLAGSEKYSRASAASQELTIVDDAHVFRPFKDRYAGLLRTGGSPPDSAGLVGTVSAAGGYCSHQTWQRVLPHRRTFDRAGECFAEIVGHPNMQLHH
jgi:hypothetical protein